MSTSGEEARSGLRAAGIVKGNLKSRRYCASARVILYSVKKLQDRHRISLNLIISCFLFCSGVSRAGVYHSRGSRAASMQTRLAYFTALECQATRSNFIHRLIPLQYVLQTEAFYPRSSCRCYVVVILFQFSGPAVPLQGWSEPKYTCWHSQPRETGPFGLIVNCLITLSHCE